MLKFYRGSAARSRACVLAGPSQRHVVTVTVADSRQTSALRGTADSLLDAASYGIRWVLLSPAAAAGVSTTVTSGGRPRPGAASVHVPTPLP
jgi:hypothetical protein